MKYFLKKGKTITLEATNPKYPPPDSPIGGVAYCRCHYRGGKKISQIIVDSRFNGEAKAGRKTGAAGMSEERENT